MVGKVLPRKENIFFILNFFLFIYLLGVMGKEAGSLAIMSKF